MPRRFVCFAAIVVVLFGAKALHAQQKELRAAPPKVLSKTEMDLAREKVELAKKQEQLEMDRAKKLIEKRDGVCYEPKVLEAKAKEHLAKETRIEADKSVKLSEEDTKYLQGMPGDKRKELLEHAHNLAEQHAEALRIQEEMRLRIQQHRLAEQARQLTTRTRRGR